MSGGLSGCLFGCDTTVATLPEDRARRVMRAMAQLQISANGRRVGNQIAIEVRPDDRASATLIIEAVDAPSVPDRPPSLVRGPTQARLDARDAERRRLEATLSTMQGVLAARIATVDGAKVAVVISLPDVGEIGGRIRAALGPTIRVVMEPIEMVERRVAASSAVPDRSAVLSAAVGVLILTILGLLAHIRRLRRSLGQ
ncbi:MAG: hypothetical protein ACI9U2_003105 [Bradymonadia bacterium]|jgi:hypothetical protein